MKYYIKTILLSLILVISVSYVNYSQIEIPEADIKVISDSKDINTNDEVLVTISMTFPEKHHAFLKSVETGLPISITSGEIEDAIKIVEFIKPTGIKEENDLILRGKNDFKLKCVLSDKTKLKNENLISFNIRYQMCDEKSGVCYRPMEKVLSIATNQSAKTSDVGSINKENEEILNQESSTNDINKENTKIENSDDEEEMSLFGRAIYGWILMFGFSLGFGFWFILLGTFSSLIKKLPKSGTWMNRIQFVFGLLMGIVTFYFINLLLGVIIVDKYPFIILIIGISLLVLGYLFGAFEKLYDYGEEKNIFQKIIRISESLFNFKKSLLRKIITLSAVIIGITFIYYGVDKLYLTPKLEYKEITTQKELDKIIATAKKENKLVFVDFWAPWCASCKAFNKNVLPNENVVKNLENFIVVKVNDDESKALSKKYDVQGLPTYVFLDGNKKILNSYEGSWNEKQFISALYKVQGKGDVEIEKSYLDILSDKLKESWKDPLIAFLFCFLGGLISVFTPCIYPLIPLTISYMGSQSTGSIRRGFINSLFYVLGMAMVYSFLGVIAALVGSAFGSFGSHPVVLVILIILFAYFTFAMFGYYEIKMPGAFQSAKQKAVTKKSSFAGMFLFGIAAGLVASPCLTPIIGTLLGLIATGAAL